MAEKDDLLEKETVAATPAEIDLFAKTLGVDTENKFFCYVYRRIKNEGDVSEKRLYVHKYSGDEPVDPDLIAQNFRGGRYLLQFMWKDGKTPKSKSFTFDVDPDCFPPIQRTPPLLGNYPVQPGSLSESVHLQLATINAITEVMKSFASSDKAAVRSQEPSEFMEDTMEMVAATYKRMMGIQQNLYERMVTSSMEKQLGLSPVGGQQIEEEIEPSLIQKYAPLVKDIIEGLKTVINMFGDKVPKTVIREVQTNDRFKALLADPEALKVVGSALRKNFGDQKANELMQSFGVKMVFRAKTPDIPGVNAVPVLPAPVNGKKPALVRPSQKVDSKLSESAKKGKIKQPVAA